jgi:hypothetical protein
MIRKIAIGVATASLAAGVLATAGAGTAFAGKVTIGPVTSANVSCNITAKATLNPALKNNWVQSQHTADPNPAVVALPNTQFATLNTQANTSAKSKGTCSGSVTDNAGHTASVTSVKVELSTLTPGVDNPPLNNNGGSTCTGLLAGTAGEDSAATYKSHVSFKASGFVIAPYDINGSTVQPAGLGFSVTGGTATGNFAGSTGTSQANVDGATLSAVIEGPPTSAAPKPTGKCQPSLKAKPAVTGAHPKPATASLKAPKGLSKLVIASGTFTVTK